VYTADQALARLKAGNKRFLNGRARMAEGVLKLAGAIYELQTGRVRFL
jgi:hypothetical protein